MSADEDARQEKIAARWCQLGQHEWHATVGGPFGYTQPDEDGYIQVCARCQIKRPVTPTEARSAEAVRELLQRLRDATREPSDRARSGVGYEG